MRLLLSLLCLLALCQLLSCGDDSNPIVPQPNLTTFQLTFDRGMSDQSYGVTEGPNGTIAVCGKSSWMGLDYENPPDQIMKYYAQLLSFTPQGDTNWVRDFSFHDGYMEYRGVTTLASGGYCATGNIAPLDYSWSNLLSMVIDEAGEITWSDTESNSTWDHGTGALDLGSDLSLIYGVADAAGQPNRLTLDCYGGGGAKMWDTTIIAPDTFLEVCNAHLLGDGKAVVLSSYYLTDQSASGGYFTFFQDDGTNTVCKPIPVNTSSRALDFKIENGVVAKMLSTSFTGGTMSIVQTALDTSMSPVSWQAVALDVPANITRGRFTSDGGAILVGYEALTAAKSAAYPVATQGCLIKLNANGVIVWRKQFSLAGATVELNDVIEYSEGGYVAVGYVQPFEGTETDYFIVKTDGNGNVTVSD